MSSPEVQLKHNYPTTWKSRLPTFLAAAGLLAVSIPTAVIAAQGTSGGNHNWWREDNNFPVQNGTLLYLIETSENPDLGRDAYRQWWGRVYALPPGVREGGGHVVIAAGAISAAFAGVGLVMSFLLRDKARNTIFRMFWRAWFGIPALVSLIALVYSFVERYTVSSVDVDGFLAAGPRIRQTFGLPDDEPIFTTEGKHSVESWSCAIRPIIDLIRSPGPRTPSTSIGYTIYPGDDNPCNSAMTARWLTIPMLVIAVLLWSIVLIYPFWSSWQHGEAGKDVEMRGSSNAVTDDRRTSDQSGKISSDSTKIPV